MNCVSKDLLGRSRSVTYQWEGGSGLQEERFGLRGEEVFWLHGVKKVLEVLSVPPCRAVKNAFAVYKGALLPVLHDSSRKSLFFLSYDSTTYPLSSLCHAPTAFARPRSPVPSVRPFSGSHPSTHSLVQHSLPSPVFGVRSSSVHSPRLPSAFAPPAVARLASPRSSTSAHQRLPVPSVLSPALGDR
jgi:hypothetical protein